MAKSDWPRLSNPVITIGIYVLFSLTNGISFDGPWTTYSLIIGFL